MLQEDPASAEAQTRVAHAIKQVALGRMVVVADDAGRENEGDLIGPADLMTEADVAFMVRHSTGILCVAIEAARAHTLALPPMTGKNEDPNATAYTVSCDALGTGTGVSAADRMLTFRTLADSASGAGALRRPGHIFPLCARRGGVLERPGHTEAAIDLMRLAGRAPAGVLAELVHDHGPMLRGAELTDFAGRHNLAFVTVAELIVWRQRQSSETQAATLVRCA